MFPLPLSFPLLFPLSPKYKSKNISRINLIIDFQAKSLDNHFTPRKSGDFFV